MQLSALAEITPASSVDDGAGGLLSGSPGRRLPPPARRADIVKTPNHPPHENSGVGAARSELPLDFPHGAVKLAELLLAGGNDGSEAGENWAVVGSIN